MPKTRRFIDKKHAVTFKLIHRSQHDPLVADERAPKRVLVAENYCNETTKKRRQEQEKFGIFFDDDYDYLQHLKETGEGVVLEPVESVRVMKSDVDKKTDTSKHGKSLMLPSSVFPSEFEESIGLLNRAAPISGPRLDLDPDIVAALEDDFDFNNPENELEDDFVAVANAVGDEHSSDMVYGTSPNAKTWSLDEEETRSRFTNYSLTSSVLRRNSELTLLDDRFEEMFAEYDDDDIGALDGDDIDGTVSVGNQLMDAAFNELREGRIKKKIEPAACEELKEVNGDSDSDSSSSDEEVVVVEQTEKWDCESILSTYSNLYNHPKVIAEPVKPKPIKVSAKTGIPVNVLKAEGLTQAQLAQHNSSSENNASLTKEVLSRPRHETTEEKKARKNAIKEQRRDRRMEKKANTLAFKEEKKRQEKIMLNLQTNLQGVTIR